MDVYVYPNGTTDDKGRAKKAVVVNDNGTLTVDVLKEDRPGLQQGYRLLLKFEDRLLTPLEARDLSDMLLRAIQAAQRLTVRDSVWSAEPRADATDDGGSQ